MAPGAGRCTAPGLRSDCSSERCRASAGRAGSPVWTVDSDRRAGRRSRRKPVVDATSVAERLGRDSRARRRVAGQEDGSGRSRQRLPGRGEGPGLDSHRVQDARAPNGCVARSSGSCRRRPRRASTGVAGSTVRAAATEAGSIGALNSIVTGLAQATVGGDRRPEGGLGDRHDRRRGRWPPSSSAGRPRRRRGQGGPPGRRRVRRGRAPSVAAGRRGRPRGMIGTASSATAALCNRRSCSCVWGRIEGGCSGRPGGTRLGQGSTGRPARANAGRLRAACHDPVRGR